MTFRQFLQAILSIPIPKPRKIKLPRIRRAVYGGLSIKPDEYLIDGKPFRFSRVGARRPVERRQK